MFRSSPRMEKRAGGDNSPSQGVECIVRWIVLSWFYPERSEQMLPREQSSSQKGAKVVCDEVGAATVGAHASVKLLAEEDGYGSSVSHIRTFLGASSSTTRGPPSPHPYSPNAESSNRAAAALLSMLEGSPSAEELEKSRQIEETEKSEQEKFLAACKAYDDAVCGKGQVAGRTRLLSSGSHSSIGSRSDRSGRLLQASPLEGATSKEWDGQGTIFGNQLSLMRGSNSMNRGTGGGGRPPMGGFGRNPLRPSQSMISLSGIAGRSPGLHGLSGAVAISSVAMPGSVGSAPKRGNRARISPMLLPSSSLVPPDEFSLGGDLSTSPLLQAQYQPQPPPRLSLVASTSTEGLALTAADNSTDSDNSFGGTPPHAVPSSHNSSSSSVEFFSYEGNSSSSLSSAAGMSRSLSGSLYGSLQGERHVSRRRPNPYRPSEIKKLHEKEKQGENVPAWRRRWANVYTPDAVRSYETADVATWQKDQGVHWQSLSKPAILPLTTKEKMGAIEAELLHADDRGKYSSHFHMATYSPGAYSSAHELLIELVCQRLLHDFQIITPSTKSDALASTTSWSVEGGSTPRPAWFSPTTSKSKKDSLPAQNEFLMSKGPYFHRLVASQDGSPSVSITRYVPRNLKYGEPVPYTYEVWHTQEQQFNARSQFFAAQDYSKSGLKWDRLDECIAACSIAEDLSRSDWSTVTKASAKRFAVVPRNPWQSEASYGGQGNLQDVSRATSRDMSRVAASSSELERGISAASQASTSSTSSSCSTAFATAASCTAWHEKTRASFKAFIRAVDELGKIDSESVAGSDSDASTDDLPRSHRVDIVIKRSGMRSGQDGHAHEWGWATYDRDFDPLKAWRLDVCWVSWAGVKVAEFIKRLASRARAHGFLLLEIPIDGNAVTGDAGNALSPTPSSFVCATTFGRRMVEHKLMHQPLTYGFRYDRRLLLNMSNYPFKSSAERRNVVREEQRWQLLIAAKQRLSLALLAWTHTTSVSPDPLVFCAAQVETPVHDQPVRSKLMNPIWFLLQQKAHGKADAGRTDGGYRQLQARGYAERRADRGALTYPAYQLARMVMCGDDSLLCKIAQAVPIATDNETAKRAQADHNRKLQERRLVHESMPLQFLHESGGAMIAVGRCGGDSELNRTVRWVDLTTGGTNGRTRVRSTTGTTTSVHASRADLAKAVEAVNDCDAIVSEIVELAFQIHDDCSTIVSEVVDLATRAIFTG
jgi:hypothetical protein